MAQGGPSQSRSASSLQIVRLVMKPEHRDTSKALSPPWLFPNHWKNAKTQISQAVGAKLLSKVVHICVSDSLLSRCSFFNSFSPG
jgi:hypothetical protein